MKSFESDLSKIHDQADAGFRYTQLALQNQSQQLEQSLPSIEQSITKMGSSIDAISSAQLSLSTQLDSVEEVINKALRRELSDHKKDLQDLLQEILGLSTDDLDV